MQDRDEAIAEAVTDEGIEVAAVARAAGLTPAEVATIVFVQEANPSPFVLLRPRTRRAAVRPADRRARRRTSTTPRRPPARG